MPDELPKDSLVRKYSEEYDRDPEGSWNKVLDTIYDKVLPIKDPEIRKRLSVDEFQAFRSMKRQEKMIEEYRINPFQMKRHFYRIAIYPDPRVNKFQILGDCLFPMIKILEFDCFGMWKQIASINETLSSFYSFSEKEETTKGELNALLEASENLLYNIRAMGFKPIYERPSNIQYMDIDLDT